MSNASSAAQRDAQPRRHGATCFEEKKAQQQRHDDGGCVRHHKQRSHAARWL
jgi:hypothetical protein